MYIVSMLSQKGGTGKTTLSLHLAVASEKAGKRAVVIDLDPQASSAEWKDSREGNTPVVVPIPSTRLPQALQAAREGMGTTTGVLPSRLSFHSAELACGS